ncbi:gastrula zinc finger protein XlCGF8.2DB-like [Sitodiplosis mosellana]|uniref:gastrula zinc finger protein XlCGF8.2DB-like n=1 Tax=Sitodiplosis mosellana TaxID=263140 RepID=UPI002444F9DF|nr:gastrula zinc finger protein XlCGF8.2DB-like [Sitodiplosis mosellana]
MNGHGAEPPNKYESNGVEFQNESILCGMEIKQEPTFKQEPENDDSIVAVSRSSHTVNSVLLGNAIGEEQVNRTDDCFDFEDLNEVKSDIKVEKVKKEANQVASKSSEKDQIQQQNPMKRLSNGGAEKVGKNNKRNGARDEKKPPEGKATGKRHKCSLCEYVTDCVSRLNRHMLKHTGERPFPCTICLKRFTQKPHLQSHMKAHVDEFLFSCSTCLQGFHRSEEKVEHESGCKVRRYECHLCKKYSTLQKTNFEAHLRVHTGERPFECDHCSKKFKKAFNLKVHLKSHTNPRPLKYKCSTCFKIFAQQMEKENHEVNCKRRGYECDLCKTYTTDHKEHLMTHIRIHTGEKPFRCETCLKCFLQKANLNMHRKMHK